MVDLVVVGGLGVDVRVRVPALPLPAADSHTVEPIELRIGNTGAGVALAATAVGLRVRVVDTLGADPRPSPPGPAGQTGPSVGSIL
ncbi:hypothetical protein [Micromonospora sp. NPDC050695]|uniref:hypothetical protein n=1 Tax=Micromonospora sp. NPDC050695 TaxID=3154938 RepID=UPI0033D6B28F